MNLRDLVRDTPSAAEPARNLANDPVWLTLLYWLFFIWAPDAAVLGNAFGYWVATHTYLIRDSSEAEPSHAREGEAKPRSRRGNREKKRP